MPFEYLSQQPRDRSQGRPKKTVTGRRIALLSLRLGFERGEELRGHHLGRALNHPLADRGERAADLHVARVPDQGRAVSLFEVEVARALEEAGLPFAVDDDAVVRGRAHLFEADVPLEDPLDRADARAQRRRVCVLAGFLQALAARDAPLQNGRVNQGLPDSLARRAQLVCAFYLHKEAVSGQLSAVSFSRFWKD